MTLPMPDVPRPPVDEAFAVLEQLIAAVWESDEIVDPDSNIARPNPAWRPFPSRTAVRIALLDLRALARVP